MFGADTRCVHPHHVTGHLHTPSRTCVQTNIHAAAWTKHWPDRRQETKDASAERKQDKDRKGGAKQAEVAGLHDAAVGMLEEMMVRETSRAGNAGGSERGREHGCEQGSKTTKASETRQTVGRHKQVIAEQAK